MPLRNLALSSTYDDLSRRAQLDYLNGTQTIYGFDALSRLTSLTNRVTATKSLITGFSYTYDDVVNRKYVTRGHDSDKGDVYTYDHIYQLTKVKYNVVDPMAESQNPGSSPFDSEMAYKLDDLGNRTSTENGGITTYTPDNMNQYTDVGGAAYTYDDDGNLTGDGSSSYQYDYENMLTRAATPGVTTYKYDGFGRRIEKNASGEITKFIYDGWQVIMETDDVGTPTAKYVYGTGIDEVLTMSRGGNTYYYQYDGLGSVANIGNSSGTNVESYSYDVYGKAAIKDGSGNPLTESAIGNPYMFTGRRFDQESGLYYYRARYYDSAIGRFLQVDPIGYWGGINLYAYVGNNPVNFVDPHGLWASQKGFYVHQRGTYRAISNSLPKNQRMALVRAQVYADSKHFQTAKYAYRHAMRGPTQTPEEARALADSFVRSQFQKAWAAEDFNDALFELGKALHALQDATSPAHENFQLWTGKESTLEKLEHALQELLDPGPGSPMYEVTEEAWEWFQSGKLPDKNLFDYLDCN